MSEWVKCSGINGVSIFVNLANVLTMSTYGAGTRLALSGNSQTYVDVAETPTEILVLPRLTRHRNSSDSSQPIDGFNRGTEGGGDHNLPASKGHD